MSEKSKGIELTPNQVMVKQWYNHAKNGVKFDSALVAVCVATCAEVKADGSPRYWQRNGDAENTPYNLFKQESIKFLDSLLASYIGDIKVVIPAKLKNGLQNPEYGRLRSLRNQVAFACCQQAGMKPDTGLVKIAPPPPPPLEGDARLNAMRIEATSIVDNTKKLAFSLDEQIAILATALEALEEYRDNLAELAKQAELDKAVNQ